MAESLSEPVQEFAKNQVLPERYIHRNIGEAIDASAPLLQVPVIDISLLSSVSTSAGTEELRKLQSALSYCGCFQAVNHGITDIFLDKFRQISKEFFALPMEEKRKYARTAEDTEGYGNDSVLSEDQTLDWTDRLYLTVSPDEQRKLSVWPDSIREILEEYIRKLKSLNELLLKAMARAINLDENSFLNQYGKQPTIIARFNYYPPCPRPDLALGVKAHADASAITFLLQDKEVEGLQVLVEDKWFRISIIPSALLVNVGDQVEIMSNGLFKSPVHRVVTNSKRERCTLAVFFIPGSEEEIGPEDNLINEIRPRLYKRVKNYVGIYFQNYQLGKRPIEAAKF